MWNKVSSNSYVESIRKTASNLSKAAKSFTPPPARLLSIGSLSLLSQPTHSSISPANFAGKAPSFLQLPPLHECWVGMMRDSNAVGGLIDMMMLSSSNSSSSGYENDAASAAAATGAAGERKRRFSEAQVKSLEVMFEEQAKLEPRKKQQLAKELGLEPRQVAIWFQNKRARWKSKQLERAYAALSADYDALRSSYDTLLHQKNVLSMQVQRLAEMLEANNQPDKKEKKESGKQFDFTATGSDGDQAQILSLSSQTNSSDVKKKVNPIFVGKELEHHHHHPHKTKEAGGGRVLVSDDNTEQKQFCFHNNGWPSDQLMTGSGCSQWWEFLSYE